VKLTVKIDAKEIQKYLRKLPLRIKGEMVKAATLSGDYLRTATQIAIEANTYGWASLDDKYVEWKQKTGFDSRILMRSHLLRHAITFRRRGLGGWVGVPSGLVYPQYLSARLKGGQLIEAKGRIFTHKERRRRSKRVAGLEPARFISQVMIWHETGGDKRKRRALFQPTRERHGPLVIKYYAEGMARAINGTKT
jgi:hypothetical protein